MRIPAVVNRTPRKRTYNCGYAAYVLYWPEYSYQPLFVTIDDLGDDRRTLMPPKESKPSWASKSSPWRRTERSNRTQAARSGDG